MAMPWAMNNKWLKKQLGWYLYQRRDLSRARLIHVTAESERVALRSRGIDRPMIVAPLGVQIDASNRGDSDRCQKSREGRKIMLFVSRVQRKKGLADLVRAWARLKQAQPVLCQDWCIRIVGPDEENHTAELKSLCDKLRIAWISSTERVDFSLAGPDVVFVGPKYGEALKEEYAGADLFVFPTYCENFGSVVIESLAQGTPVVCSKGAPWAVLEKEQCGWWVDVGAEPLREGLRRAMSISDEERNAMGRKGREFVRRAYTWEAVGAELMQAYETVLSC